MTRGKSEESEKRGGGEEGGRKWIEGKRVGGGEGRNEIDLITILKI